MPYCRICNEYILNNKPHQCPPVFFLNCEDYHGDEWEKVYAYDENEAATKWVEKYDSDDRCVAGGGEVIVLVRKEGDSKVKKISITGEFVPHYRTIEIESDEMHQMSKSLTNNHYPE
jgi:hypothetical protein